MPAHAHNGTGSETAATRGGRLVTGSLPSTGSEKCHSLLHDTHPGTIRRQSHCGTSEDIRAHCGTSQDIKAHCGTSHSIRVHCRTSQDIRAHCGTSQDTRAHWGTSQDIRAHCGTSQDTRAHWGTSQDIRAHCGTSQDTRAHWGTSQDIRAHCGTSQDTSVFAGHHAVLMNHHKIIRVAGSHQSSQFLSPGKPQGQVENHHTTAASMKNDMTTTFA